MLTQILARANALGFHVTAARVKALAGAFIMLLVVYGRLPQSMADCWNGLFLALAMFWGKPSGDADDTAADSPQ